MLRELFLENVNNEDFPSKGYKSFQFTINFLCWELRKEIFLLIWQFKKNNFTVYEILHQY